jgi:hypothetical protein
MDPMIGRLASGGAGELGVTFSRNIMKSFFPSSTDGNFWPGKMPTKNITASSFYYRGVLHVNPRLGPI